MTHEKWLSQTIEMAIQNVMNGGGPFAAIIVNDGEVIGSGTNRVHLLQDLSDCVLYASGEPCPMCLGATYWATVGNVYYACSKTEALNGAGFTNPLKNFFADQQEPAENRSVPFIQLKSSRALEPFHEWNRVNGI